MKKYQIIYADPPWQFKNYSDKWHREHIESRWVGKHYPIMDSDDISSLPIMNIADVNCVLFLWATYPKLDDALTVIMDWGFEYKTVAFTWVKQNKKGTGLWLGMGYWTRSNPEICLLATKGHPKRINASVRQVILSPRLEHSQKPPEIREGIVQLLGDLPRIELFARQKVEGWDCWGNEVKSDIEL